MPENKKYLDLQGLGKYHEKAMGIIDKKINWDNLKNKPFGIVINSVPINGVKPTAFKQMSSTIENMPALEAGDSYTVVFNDQTYNDLPVFFKTWEDEASGASMVIAGLGNEALCARRILTAFGVYSPEDISAAEESAIRSDLDFCIIQMTLMGETQYLVGQTITDYSELANTFSWTLKDASTEADLCSCTESYNATGDLLASLLPGSGGTYGTYYLDAEEMALLPTIANGTQLQVSANGGEPEIYEFTDNSGLGMDSLLIAQNNSEDSHFTFVYSPVGGILQLNMGVGANIPLFGVIYTFDTENNELSADLAIQLTTIEKLDKRFYDTDWTDMQNKPFFIDHENPKETLYYLHIDNEQRHWAAADQASPVDITDWITTYGSYCKLDSTTGAGANHLITPYGDTVTLLSGTNGTNWLNTLAAQITKGVPYDVDGSSDYLLPIYAGNDSLRITPTSDPKDPYYDDDYTSTAAGGNLRITFTDASRTAVDKCYLEDIWFYGTEGTHSFSLGHFYSPSSGGFSQFSADHTFTATCAAPAEGDESLTVFEVNSKYYFPAEFDESKPYKVTFKDQEYTLYPYHLSRARCFENTIEGAWDQIHPFKPDSCLSISKSSNQRRYSGWVFGDLDYLDRKFGRSYAQEQNGTNVHVSTSRTPVNFCLFRSDDDPSRCFLLAEVPTRETAVISIHVPTIHTLDKVYLPVIPLTQSEVNDLFNN